MALGKKTARLIALAALAGGLVRAGEVRFEIRHDHLRKGCQGVMTVDDTGIYFLGPKNHVWSWHYEDIQELKLSPDHIHLLTYWDSKPRLGADRAFDFTGRIPGELYARWNRRLDARFVAELADRQVKPLWEIPVKHLGRIMGSEGTLEIGADRIVYKTDQKDDSRTWRFPDIENISTSGPYDLTITTFEHATFHYGNRKEFRFQLKQALNQASYDELWRKLNDTKGRTP